MNTLTALLALLTPKRRKWLYALCLAALPLLVAYGLVDVKVAPLWAAFVVALLNVNE